MFMCTQFVFHHVGHFGLSGTIPICIHFVGLCPSGGLHVALASMIFPLAAIQVIFSDLINGALLSVSDFGLAKS